MSDPSMMDPEKLAIVIALFEREYPEERIKKAIRHCNSVDSAIEWLEKESGAAAPSTPTSKSASVPARAAAKENQNQNNRRRLNSKSKQGSTEAVDQKPVAVRPVLDEQPPAPPSDSKASSHPSPSASDGVAEAPQPVQAPSPVPAASSAVPEPPPQMQPEPRSTELDAQPMVIVTDAVATLAAPLGLPDPLPCDACDVKTEMSEQIPLVEIHPMEPDVAADWWAKARERWPEIRQQLLGVKRPSSSESADGAATPTKKLCTGIESPVGTPIARPPASPQGSGGSATASAAKALGEEMPLSSEEASATKPTSPTSSSARLVGQFASRSLRSPLPTGKVSSRRASWTPGTSPRAQMNNNTSTEMCEICCNDVKSGKAVKLGCGHGWYCNDCMQRHAEARLEVGAAHVACPECSAPIAECNLRKMLSPELMERLLARSLEQAVSSTSDLWACPTPNCPMRVALEDGEEPRLVCPECNKESCLRCGAQPYHKGLTCDEYAEKMRARGRKKAEAKAEDSFKKWMEETGTKQCPTCKIAVTKLNLGAQSTQYQECHKMVCRNCSTKFCFKCCKILTESFTCGCSIDKHGFVDPVTGKRIEHLRPQKGRPAAKAGSRTKAR